MSFALFLAKNLHLSIGKNFCTFLAKKKCTLVSPLLNGAEFTLSVAKIVALFETVPNSSFCFCQMVWHVIEAPKKTIEFLAAPSFSSKKWIKLIPKTIGNRKRDCASGCARGINTTWENLQIEKHKSGGRSFRSPDWFVLFDLQIFSGGVYQPHAQSLFLFPIVFGIRIRIGLIVRVHVRYRAILRTSRSITLTHQLGSHGQGSSYYCSFCVFYASNFFPLNLTFPKQNTWDMLKKDFGTPRVVSGRRRPHASYAPEFL